MRARASNRKTQLSRFLLAGTTCWVIPMPLLFGFVSKGVNEKMKLCNHALSWSIERKAAGDIPWQLSRLHRKKIVIENQIGHYHNLRAQHTQYRCYGTLYINCWNEIAIRLMCARCKTFAWKFTQRTASISIRVALEQYDPFIGDNRAVKLMMLHSRAHL